MEDMMQARQLIVSRLIQGARDDRNTFLRQLRKANKELHRLVLCDLMDPRSKVRAQSLAAVSR